MNNKTFQKINTLLFDLDGTLLDSFPVHLEIFKTTFAQFGIHLSEEEFLKTYSPNWYETYKAFGLRKEDWETADSFWLKEAEKITARLFPGVKEILLKLDKYFTLGLVTSGSKSRVERDMKATSINIFFKTIVTGDDIQTPKPSPEGLEIALRNLDKQPDEAIYIGDSSADYEMAKAAGVYFIGVTSEFNSLSSNHPDYNIHSLNDLPKLMGVK
ncbi:MAG TPA: HAD family hydrolase [Ignavibacteriaceae bacterium]|nr:HAD family hydrolase [Ignavibacteriaceae bacterium]